MSNRTIGSDEHRLTQDDINQCPDSVVGAFLCKLFARFHQCKITTSYRQFSYRGQSSSEFALTPGIFRNDCFYDEKEMFKDFRLMEPDEFPERLSIYENLIKMQHYELPTRLLDVTFNPLVALFSPAIAEIMRIPAARMGAFLYLIKRRKNLMHRRLSIWRLWCFAKQGRRTSSWSTAFITGLFGIAKISIPLKSFYRFATNSLCRP